MREDLMENKNDFTLNFELKGLHDTVVNVFEGNNASNSQNKEMASLTHQTVLLLSELNHINHSMSSQRRKSLEYLMDCFRDLKMKLEEGKCCECDQAKNDT